MMHLLFLYYMCLQDMDYIFHHLQMFLVHMENKLNLYFQQLLYETHVYILMHNLLNMLHQKY